MAEPTKLALPGGLNLWHLILMGMMAAQALLGMNSRDNMMVAFKTHAEDFEEGVKKDIHELQQAQVRLTEQSGSLDVLKNELEHAREDIRSLTQKVDLLIDRKR